MKVRSPQYEASQEDNKEIGRKVKVSEIIASHWEIRSTLQRADSVSLGLFLSLKVRERKGLRSGQWGGGDYRRGTHLNHLSEFWCNNVSLLVLSKALSHQDKAGRRTTYSVADLTICSGPAQPCTCTCVMSPSVSLSSFPLALWAGFSRSVLFPWSGLYIHFTTYIFN